MISHAMNRLVMVTHSSKRMEAVGHAQQISLQIQQTRSLASTQDAREEVSQKMMELVSNVITIRYRIAMEQLV